MISLHFHEVISQDETNLNTPNWPSVSHSRSFDALFVMHREAASANKAPQQIKHI
jgi:hypothetical protein